MTPVLSLDSIATGAREKRRRGEERGGESREAEGGEKREKDSDRTEVTTLHFLLVSMSRTLNLHDLYKSNYFNRFPSQSRPKPCSLLFSASPLWGVS